jgi:hypothetical protein
MKKEPIQTLVPEKKYLTEIAAVSLSTAFFLGLIYSPPESPYTKLSVVTNTEVETVYVDKVIDVSKKIKIPEINEYAYSSRSYGYEIRKLNVSEFRKFLQNKGFRNLDKVDLYKMRRVWVAYKYESMLMNVHLMTDFPVSMIYSFFIIEATNKGIETDLWRVHSNAGGIKSLKGHGFVTFRTREVIRGRNKYIKAKFFSSDDTEEGIKIWADVLNSNRYKRCKKPNYKLSKMRVYESKCRCIYENGYHTDSDYKFRASLMAEFWDIKGKHFPKHNESH